MNVLMVGVDKSTKGGMWTVVENYLKDKKFVEKNGLIYIPTALTGCSNIKKLLFTFRAYLKIIHIYRKTNIDIVHIHMSERASIRRKKIIMDYAKKHNSKIVLHMHGAEFELLYNTMNEKKRRFVKKTLNTSDRIIILGEYWKEFIESLVEDRHKIQVVYNAVSVPENYNYNKNSNFILFLGAVSKRKGIHILIDALKIAAKDLSNIASVKIYGPDLEGNIEEVIFKEGLTEWVHYCGWLDSGEKSDVLKNTAVNVLPSYNEGLPMTILEAMSYGVPSITTNIAAIPEVVNSSNGIIIKPGDSEELAKSIIKIIMQKDFRLRLSKQAYEDAAQFFSVEKHIRIIQSIYDGLLENG